MTATLTAYFGERKRAGGRLVADGLLDLFAEHRVARSVLLRGVEGFGARHHLRTDDKLSLSEDLPAVALAVDADERIAELAPAVRALVRSGLVGVEPADGARNGDVRLTLLLGRKDRVDGRPAYRAVVDLLRAHGVAGATTLLGVDGTTGDTRLRARFFARNADVPMMVSVVASAAELAAVGPALAALPGAVAASRPVQVCKRDGTLLAPPDPREGELRMTVYSAETALHDGAPIHRALVRRLRADGVRGVTTLRGVWGFSGDHPPHGDRWLQLGRQVPAVTTVVDTAERIAHAFPAVDELTAEHGLVICEPVRT